MSPLYILFTADKIYVNSSIHDKKRLFTIYTILLNLREEWLCTEQRSRYTDRGIRLMLVIGR